MSNNVKIVYNIKEYPKIVLDIPVKIKKLNEKAVAPKYASENAAGVDLHSINSMTIEPGTCKLVPTGLAMAIPNGWFGAIHPRSGLAVKQGLRLANGCGIIDADYRGEILVALYNDSQELRIIEPGERIAQMIIMPCPKVNYIEVDELDETERGSGGFGSTGTN